MGRKALASIVLALTGCGARSSFGTESGETSGPAPEVACVVNLCGSLGLNLGTSDCNFNWHDAPDTAPSLEFNIVGGYQADIGPGAVFQVGMDPRGPVIGARLSATIQEGLTGTLEFTTYDPIGGATGSYDVQSPSGHASGTFSAERCPDSCTP
jgi:hypothetical protein